MPRQARDKHREILKKCRFLAGAAAFAFRQVGEMAGIVDIMSWWTFTDIFEEGGTRKPPFLGPGSYENAQFTDTGSEQTLKKVKGKGVLRRFSRGSGQER